MADEKQAVCANTGVQQNDEKRNKEANQNRSSRKHRNVSQRHASFARL